MLYQPLLEVLLDDVGQHGVNLFLQEFYGHMVVYLPDLLRLRLVVHLEVLAVLLFVLLNLGDLGLAQVGLPLARRRHIYLS